MVRFLAYIFTGLTLSGFAGLIAIVGAWSWYSRGLPDHEKLAQYEPATLSRVYSSSGEPLAEFAREKRIFAPIEQVPVLVKNAFISAEDKNFYSHAGFDARGMVAAVYDVVKSRGEQVRGASTITQQVMKNFLLSGEKSFERKMKEVILAVRIEQTLSKDRILELYLNEIFLGARSYGIAAASQNYFGKGLDQLSAGEAAYLAALPKAPSRMHPVRNYDYAYQRRNYVLEEMAQNGHLDRDEAEVEKQAPLVTRLNDPTIAGTGVIIPPMNYFTEEVRRQLADDLGIDQVLGGGLTIRATLDDELQTYAAQALRRGLENYDRARGYAGPLETIEGVAEAGEAFWRDRLSKVKAARDVEDWHLAVVLQVGKRSARVGIEGVAEDEDGHYVRFDDVSRWAAKRLRNGRFGKRPRKPADVWTVGDVIYVKGLKGDDGKIARWSMRQIPEIQGAFMAMDAHTGRVLAVQGGFSYEASVFNRATQATRQPGSSFKPVIYASALELGYTPATVVLDAPVAIDQGNGEIWKPKNYTDRFYGPSPLRLGIEKSRNLMTVRIAQEVGMDVVADYARRLGVYDDMPPLLSYSLGSGETTLQQMVAAFAMFANGGKKVTPSLVDRIQDRRGKTIYRHDQRYCDGCEDAAWIGQVEPRTEESREQVMDPVTAYQMVSMLQGVATRGTASKLRKLGFPVAGKTGTTNEAKDAWFVGFTPDIVAGCFIGFDTPRPMGKGATGGGLCAPVFADFMRKAMKNRGKKDFKAPKGIMRARINRHTGQRVPDSYAGGDYIWEIFREDNVPEMFASAGDIRVEGDDWLPTFDSQINNASSSSDPGRPKPGGSIGLGTGGLY